MRLLYSFLKDLKVSFKSLYIYIEVIMAIIIIVFLVFVMPENFSANEKVVLYMDEFVESNLGGDQIKELADDNVLRVDDKSLIRGIIEEERNTFGAAIYFENDKLIYDITLQGYEGQKFRNIIERVIILQMAEEAGVYESQVSFETLDGVSERLSDRINILPVFLALNSAFVGLFIIAAYIFMDKGEGTIKAFAVTPARVWEYLLSKVGIMLVTGLGTALLTTIFVAGRNVNYLHLIVLLITTNIFGTTLGLYISSFYDNIMKAMGALYIAIIVLALASVSYFLPGFSPWPITLLPSYPMLFAFRETFLSSPDVAYIYGWSAMFLAMGVVLFIMSNERFKKTITA